MNFKIEELEQIEEDLDKQFSDKMLAAIEHMQTMYDIAGIPAYRAMPAIAAECLKTGIFVVAHSSDMSKGNFLRMCAKIFDNAKEWQRTNPDNGA